MAMITGPSASTLTPSDSYSTPYTLPDSSNRRSAFADLMIEALGSCSSFLMSAEVIAQPGAPPFPRCVRGIEWPPNRATSERSTPNLVDSQARVGAELDVKAWMRFGRARWPADAVVSLILKSQVNVKDNGDDRVHTSPRLYP